MPNRRFISLTTPMEVIPSGLSTIRRPSIPIILLSFLVEVMDHLVDMNGILNRWIKLKEYVRSVPEARPASEFFSYLTPGAVEPFERPIAFIGVSHDTEIDPCHSTIIRDQNPGDGEETNPGILDGLQKDHFRDFFTDHVGYFF